MAKRAEVKSGRRLDLKWFDSLFGLMARLQAALDSL